MSAYVRLTREPPIGLASFVSAIFVWAIEVLFLVRPRITRRPTSVGAVGGVHVLVCSMVRSKYRTVADSALKHRTFEKGPLKKNTLTERPFEDRLLKHGAVEGRTLKHSISLKGEEYAEPKPHML